jgi:hypothetical protein
LQNAALKLLEGPLEQSWIDTSTQPLKKLQWDQPREWARRNYPTNFDYQAECSRRRLAVIRRCPASLTVLAIGAAFLSSQPGSARADGINSSATAGAADYTLTTTTALPAPTGPPPGTPVVTLSTTITSGSPSVTLPTGGSVSVGYGVSGNGIPAGTTVTQVSTSGIPQLTLSHSATTSGTGSLTFTPNIAPPQVVALIQPPGGVVVPPASSTQGPLTILPNSKGFNSSGVYDFLASKTDGNGQALQALGLSFYGQGLAAGGILNFSLNVASQNTPPRLVSQTTGVTITLSQTPPPSTPTDHGVPAAETPEPLSLLLWSVLAGVGLVRARAVTWSNRA